MSNIEDRVQNIIHEIGVPAHIKGYQYVREAVCIAVNDPGALASVDGNLYPRVAKIFQTTSSRVERAVSHAIEIACDRGDLETIQRLFGPAVTGARSKPSNSEFITRIAEYVKNQEDNT